VICAGASSLPGSNCLGNLKEEAMRRTPVQNLAMVAVLGASAFGVASTASAKTDYTLTSKAAVIAAAKGGMEQLIVTAEPFGSPRIPASANGRSRPASLVATSAVAQDTAAAPEKNPPGDIPDDQVFIQYRSPLGFSIKVPEGWQRQERADGARFSDKYNIIDLAVSKTDQAPNAASARTGETVELKKTGHAVEIRSVKDVKLKSGPAVLISYASNSEPNPVTNKVIRLEHDLYLMFKNGTLVSLDLSAPLGADNADQWQLMSNSFGWR
jgi:hypothetical protein